MSVIEVEYKQSIYNLTDGEFEHVHTSGTATHKEEVFGAYWSAELENSFDTAQEVDICDDCGEPV